MDLRVVYSGEASLPGASAGEAEHSHQNSETDLLIESQGGVPVGANLPCGLGLSLGVLFNHFYGNADETWSIFGAAWRVWTTVLHLLPTEKVLVPYVRTMLLTKIKTKKPKQLVPLRTTSRDIVERACVNMKHSLHHLNSDIRKETRLGPLNMNIAQKKCMCTCVYI